MTKPYDERRPVRSERKEYDERSTGDYGDGGAASGGEHGSNYGSVGEAEMRRRQTDERRELRAGFRGRGPKNYRRTDERILEDIHERLTEHDLIDASDIEVEVNGGEVVLSGWVEDRQSKRLAEFITEDVIGVLHVENRLRIKHPTETTPGTFGSIEDLSANYSQKVYGNPAVAIREETEKSEELEHMTRDKEQGKTAES